ncbi:hypothetical protein BCF74_10440 [Knoellia remsis]|uniref:Peptidase S8/S53 domain-containing protein n=1 Tax=Knoellia remsis TaxID=407159 RepID=A0A2T0UXJ0_9MICO|nr:hypothetical protein BCF74_10440 [Knoellia remsis]
MASPHAAGVAALAVGAHDAQVLTRTLERSVRRVFQSTGQDPTARERSSARNRQARNLQTRNLQTHNWSTHSCSDLRAPSVSGEPVREEKRKRSQPRGGTGQTSRSKGSTSGVADASRAAWLFIRRM